MAQQIVFDNTHKERIRFWILANIHMVWDQVKKLQEIQDKGFVLRISFHEHSWPIVCQWHKPSATELQIGSEQEKDCYISEGMWFISGNFSSINTFLDWVRNVDYRF